MFQKTICRARFKTKPKFKLNRLEAVKIPKDFDYKKLKSISAEALEKLNSIKPETISQASRISGVSPNDISVLLVYMGR